MTRQKVVSDLSANATECCRRHDGILVACMQHHRLGAQLLHNLHHIQIELAMGNPTFAFLKSSPATIRSIHHLPSHSER